jgi:hypothetical protein
MHLDMLNIPAYAYSICAAQVGIFLEVKKQGCCAFCTIFVK